MFLVIPKSNDEVGTSHSSHQYLLSTYCALCTVLDGGPHSTEQDVQGPRPHGTGVLVGETEVTNLNGTPYRVA